MHLLWAYEHDFVAISPFLYETIATLCHHPCWTRGSPAGALGDLRVTVRASPPGTPPRTSYSSRSENPVRFPGDFAGLSHGVPSISFGAPSVDRMSIAASGDGLTSSEDEGVVGLPPSGVVATAATDPELMAMLARAAVSIGLEVNRRLRSTGDESHGAVPREGDVHHGGPGAPSLAQPGRDEGRRQGTLSRRPHLPGRAVRRHRRGLCPVVLGGTAADRGDPAHLPRRDARSTAAPGARPQSACRRGRPPVSSKAAPPQASSLARRASRRRAAPSASQPGPKSSRKSTKRP